MCPGSQPAMQNTPIALATRMMRTIQAKISRPLIASPPKWPAYASAWRRVRIRPLFQFHRHPAELAGELERRCVAEVDRRAGVLADVLPLVQRVFKGSRLFHAAFADLPAIGEQRNCPTLAHTAAVGLEVHRQCDLAG